METLSLRAKLGWVAAGYAAVVAASTFLVAWRYMQYRWHPADANQYGAMWAGGDMILGVFIFCLFMVPTFFLVLVARKSEPLYVGYAKVLFYQFDCAGIGRAVCDSDDQGIQFAAGLVLHVAAVGIAVCFGRDGRQPVAGTISASQVVELVCGADRSSHTGGDDGAARGDVEEALTASVAGQAFALC